MILILLSNILPITIYNPLYYTTVVMNTITQLENKPISELSRKELKQIASIKMLEQKEQLQKDLDNIDTIYVSYLNNQGTEMMFYYIVEEEGKKPYLTKVWISRPRLYSKDYNESIDLEFKDKPHSWEKSRSGQYHYCFRATGYGYSKSDHCLDSLYSWLYGYGSDKRRSVRIENLN